MKLKFIVPLVGFLLMSVLLGIGLTMNPRDIPSTRINKPAPPFELPMLTEASRNFSPSELLGQRWILNVWASWCVSCRYEHPLFNELAAAKLAPIVGLNYKDTPENAQQWLNERGNPYYKIPMDIKGGAGIEWGVIAVPETFIIDESGVVIFKHTGPITPKILNTEMVPLLTASANTN